MTEIKHFEFYINFAGIDDYCFWIIDKYGEMSNVVTMLNADYERLMHSHNECKDILLEVRKYLAEKEGRTLSNYIEHLLIEAINKNKSK